MTLYKLAEIAVDFNASAPGGLIKASKRFLFAAWYDIAAGAAVLMTDADGNACVGEIVEVNGVSLKIRPIWETWISGSPALHLDYSGVIGAGVSVGSWLEPSSSATALTQLTVVAA